MTRYTAQAFAAAVALAITLMLMAPAIAIPADNAVLLGVIA